jgi:hypothetical protein
MEDGPSAAEDELTGACRRIQIDTTPGVADVSCPITPVQGLEGPRAPIGLSSLPPSPETTPASGCPARLDLSSLTLTPHTRDGCLLP